MVLAENNGSPTGTYMYSYISITPSLRIIGSQSTDTFFASVCASARVGMIHPPATRIYLQIPKSINASLVSANVYLSVPVCLDQHS